MDLLTKFDYKMNPASFIRKLIEKWSPRKCVTEKDYEESLYAYLHKEIDDPSIDITKQFAIGRKKADIKIGNDAIIELKKDLGETGQYDRLMGQLKEYQQWKGAIFVVLVGEHEPNLRKKLIKESGMGSMWDEAKFIVIEK